MPCRKPASRSTTFVFPSVLVAFLVAAYPPAAPQSLAGTIGPLTNPANGHTYYVTDDLMTWDAGEAWAVGLGGHLVAIDDAAENAWIVANLPPSPDWFWSGGRDTVEGTFEWVSGAPWAYTNWLPGEPDDDVAFGSLGDFVAIDRVTGTWFDTNGHLPQAGGVAEILPPTGVDRGAGPGGDVSLVLRTIPTRDGRIVRIGSSRAIAVHLGVFDVSGRPVRTLFTGELAVGTHDHFWDERDHRGRRVAGGLYFVSLRGEGVRRTGRVIVAR